MSPPHEAIAEGDELETRKRLGEDIGKLVFCRDVLDINGVGNNMGSEVVKADREMFCARASAMVGGDFDATLVVFKDGATDSGGAYVEIKIARA